MTNEQFNARVLELEAFARRDPAAYRTRVMLFALLGNAYLAAVLLVAAGLLAAAIASITVLKAIGVKLAGVAACFLWLLLRALWLRVPPPAGTPVDAGQAPELFALIASLQRQLGAPRFDHVLITDDFNAAVVQVPRLGIFGWPRNYLLLGLPLMQALDDEQFKAVLAHEFGHLAGGHGRWANWIYRLRLRWQRVLALLGEARSGGQLLLKPFFDWYAPRFSAWSFPLARAQEYEADATAARLTSSRAAAAALSGVEVVAGYLGERYWPQIHNQADEVPQPAFAPYSAMGRQLAGDIDDDAARRWLERATARRTDCSDTHPALSDRLAALGEAAHLALPAPGAAAERLLGAALPQLKEAFDRGWRERISQAWGDRHREVQANRRRLAELDAAAAQGEALSLQDAGERARLTESTAGDPDAALAQWRSLAERAPDDVVVAANLGRRLLDRDDDAGIALVERAMGLDDEARLAACEILRDYHWRRGREEEARSWHARGLEFAGRVEAARDERNQILLGERCDRHGLDAAKLARLQRQLRAIPQLRRAYLVRKRVQYHPERPCYVLAYSANAWYLPASRRRIDAVLARIQADVELPGETLIICVDGPNYRFGRRFFWMSGARIC